MYTNGSAVQQIGDKLMCYSAHLDLVNRDFTYTYEGPHGAQLLAHLPAEREVVRSTR